MMMLMREGGAPMWFVLLFGATALLLAAMYAARGQRRAFELARGMGVATILASMAATFADLGATLAYVAKMDAPSRVLIEGLGESMAPGIMGFALTALAAVFVAVGRGRAASSIAAP
jgi:hypothetical protein